MLFVVGAWSVGGGVGGWFVVGYCYLLGVVVVGGCVGWVEYCLDDFAVGVAWYYDFVAWSGCGYCVWCCGGGCCGYWCALCVGCVALAPVVVGGAEYGCGFAGCVVCCV